MSYDEFKKPWDEDYNYLCFDRSRKKDQERYFFVKEAKTHIQSVHLGLRLFD